MANSVSEIFTNCELKRHLATVPQNYLNKNMKITIVAHPNSKKPRIEKDLFGSLHINVSESPLEGKANKTVVGSLADHFNTKRSCVLLVSGERSKNKTFEISE